MPDIDALLQLIGARIRELRKARGWSIEQLAERAERHPTFVGGIERGERNVTLETLLLVARALDVDVVEILGNDHDLTKKWGCSPKDVLDAVNRGFRSQVDVKGKLAELRLNGLMQKKKSEGLFAEYVWNDKDGLPDFEVRLGRQNLRIECKNLRSGHGFAGDVKWKVELQKTRDSKKGKKTRAYAVDDFEVLAVCTFNQDGKWRFLFVRTANLVRRPDDEELLKVFQPVPIRGDGRIWFDEIEGVL